VALNRLLDLASPWIAERLLAGMGGPPIRISLWNGCEVGRPEAKAVGRLCIRDRRALARLILDPEFQAGELYTEGRLEIEGDAVELISAVFRGRMDTGLLNRLLPEHLLRRALHNGLRAARRNAHHHYDVGNDFYQLWLDERLLYTCAYFPTPEATLEEAQLAKMDHVCRKLALRPGQRVIEAGCGWGALALHMARYYNLRVRAFNVASEQIAYAREQAEKQGLQGRVEFIDDDYRNISGRCDAFVSVGMLEHVGKAHFAELGEVIDRCLRPQGLGFIHSIGRSQPRRLNPWIEQRVFPNAYPPTLREMMDVFEGRNFAVLDVENLRRHYRLTAQHWLERFRRSRAHIEEMVGVEKARTWELYLAGTVAAFETSSLHLYQVLFSRSANNRIPWTREHCYSGEAADFGEAAE
jgi:cyclopropane-fatty-acyl-phospholipid synthase